MSYKFKSNADEFVVNVELMDVVKGFFPHIGLTAREGISIMYKLPKEKNWLNIGCFLADSSITINMSDFVEKNEEYLIMIYCPILTKLSKLEVIISDNFDSKKIDNLSERNITIAGGPISYGIGCTTVTNMFSNIIERKFDAHVNHIAYNMNNYLEAIQYYYTHYNPPVADIGIIELDYFSQNESVVEEVLPKIIALMKKRCKHIIGWYCIPKEKSFKKIIANNTIKDYVYNNDLEILDLSYLYDDKHMEKCVYNLMYINDTGNILIYKELSESIRRIMKWNI